MGSRPSFENTYTLIYFLQNILLTKLQVSYNVRLSLTTSMKNNNIIIIIKHNTINNHNHTFSI